MRAWRISSLTCFFYMDFSIQNKKVTAAPSHERLSNASWGARSLVRMKCAESLKSLNVTMLQPQHPGNRSHTRSSTHHGSNGDQSCLMCAAGEGRRGTREGREEEKVDATPQSAFLHSATKSLVPRLITKVRRSVRRSLICLP